MGRLSLWKILNFLATTFLGNLIISCCLLVPVIVIQYVYRRRGPTKATAISSQTTSKPGSSGPPSTFT